MFRSSSIGIRNAGIFILNHEACYDSTKLILFGAAKRIIYRPLCSATNNKKYNNNVATDNSPSAVKSKRRQFKDIQPHPGILKHIRMIGVGIPSRETNKNRQRNNQLEMMATRSRSPKNKKRNEGSSSPRRSWKQPPLPFGPKSCPIKIAGSVGALPSDRDRFPKNIDAIPEVALAGRSNVGKSTLLNAILYGNRSNNNPALPNAKSNIRRRRSRGPHKTLSDEWKLPKGVKAKTSPKPGETRRITFYELASRRLKEEDDNIIGDSKKRINKPSNNSNTRKLWLADLPGYGFAYVKDEDSAAYSQLVSNYLLRRGKNLKRVLMLLDARHGMKKADVDFLEMLQEQQQQQQQRSRRTTTTNRRRLLLPPIQLVLTKCDLVTQKDLARRAVQARQQLSECLRREPSQLPVMLVSARGAGVGLGGILELQKDLASLVPPSQRKAATNLKNVY